MRVWSWVKGKLMPLSCRAWDPVACFRVYTCFSLWARNGNRR